MKRAFTFLVLGIFFKLSPAFADLNVRLWTFQLHSNQFILYLENPSPFSSAYIFVQQRLGNSDYQFISESRVHDLLKSNQGLALGRFQDFSDSSDLYGPLMEIDESTSPRQLAKIFSWFDPLQAIYPSNVLRSTALAAFYLNSNQLEIIPAHRLHGKAAQQMKREVLSNFELVKTLLALLPTYFFYKHIANLPAVDSSRPILAAISAAGFIYMVNIILKVSGKRTPMEVLADRSRRLSFLRNPGSFLHEAIPFTAVGLGVALVDRMNCLRALFHLGFPS